MKNKILFTVIIILFFSLTAQATVYVNENWDTGTPDANWPKCGSGTSFHGWEARSWDCDVNQIDGVSGGTGAGLSNAHSHSGAWSYHNVKHNNVSYDAGEIGYTLPAVYPIVYIRFYLYIDNTQGGWATYGQESYADDTVHFMFVNTALSNSGFRLNLMSGAAADTWPPACYSTSPKQNLYLNCQFWDNDCLNATSGSPLGSSCSSMDIYPKFNTWHSYEYMIDTTNNLYSFWVDGVAMFTNLNYTSSSSHTFSNDITYNGSHGVGWVLFSLFNSGAANFQLDYYIDDIVISDTYNGTTEGGGGTPSTTSSSMTLGTGKCTGCILK
jgi:hypothetical protein